MKTRFKLLLPLFIAAAGLLSLPVNADQLQAILDEGTIKIGVPENFPPFGSVGKDFKHQG